MGLALRLGWRAHPAAAVTLALLTVLTGLLPIGAAWCTKVVFDGLATGAPAPRVIGFAVAGAVLGGLSVVLGYLAAQVNAVAQAAVALAAGEELYRRVAGFVGIAPFEEPAFRDRLALAEQAAQQAPQVIVSFAVTAGQSVLRVAGFAAVLVTLNPSIAALLLAAAVPELFIQLALARRRAAAAEAANPSFRARTLFQSLLTDVRAARESRIFGLGDLFRDRMLGALRQAYAVELRAGRQAALVQSGLALASAAVLAAGTVVALRGVLRGELGIGDLTLFLGALASLQGGLSAVLAQLGEVGATVRLFGHYARLVGTDASLVDGGRPAPPLRLGLTFEDVWFRYRPDGPWVLRGVTLTIPARSLVGLVGVNGAGKSTLVKLACRFYDPERGRILWDGEDVRDLSAASLRRRIGAVFQDFMAYDLTAAENIGVGEPTRLHDTDAIRGAARTARIDETLAALPRGYATMLSRIFAGEDGEEGAALSGGQWQRVALARSLLRDDADLLILDEPTAALDPQAAHELTRALRQARTGRAGLLISHRLSALRDAGLIVVLDGGVVAEIGDHDTLMAAGGAYARLFSLQAADYQDERVRA
ncbi:ABC transporter ATP-binding protein [Hamadaea tsunoensis]|uniref:ABC transporter ATP-binding protein n=1 Tax=Hamadaea tsunoensis TaxID=53368 RepID=UPI000425AAA9|nr:ABC transporter ATP-binding protein [Hamadaea tsunoensis]